MSVSLSALPTDFLCLKHFERKTRKQLFAYVARSIPLLTFLPAPALAVVPLQCSPGFGLGRSHFALQDEEQQHPHVAGGRNTGGLREKGDASL